MRGHKCTQNPSQPFRVSLNTDGIPVVNCTQVKNRIRGISKQDFTSFDAAIMFNRLHELGARVGKINDLLITFDGIAKHWAWKLEKLEWNVNRRQIRDAIELVSRRKGSLGNGPSEQLEGE
jgi:hypothetical protein